MELRAYLFLSVSVTDRETEDRLVTKLVLKCELKSVNLSTLFWTTDSSGMAGRIKTPFYRLLTKG